MNPLVSIITVNYNSLGVTRELLISLRKISYQTIEVIVVDNASKVDPGDIIISEFPEVRFIRSEENLGFAGGNNLGIRHSRGKYLLFINNDTEVDKAFLEPLVALLENNNEIGMVCPKILYYNSGELIQYVGSSKINPYTGRNTRIGYMEIDTGQFDEVRETEIGHGAAMMVPREVILKVGMMPEIFFLYYEEIDWCESIKKNGYLIYVNPKSVVYHKESQSTGKNSPIKTYYLTRNRLLHLRRFTSGIKKISWIVFFVSISIPKNTLVYILKGQFRHLLSFWSGILWNLSH